MNGIQKNIVGLLLGFFTMSSASASVSLMGTRVIYDGAKKEASVQLENPDKTPYLVQSWVNMPDGAKDKKAPFVITPPLFRLDPQQKNVLRIILTSPLPEDKESLFWLNVKGIPGGPTGDNSIQIAVNTVVKLIYRPKSLGHSIPTDHKDQLTWQRSGIQLQVSNASPYYINFGRISVAGKKLEKVTYVAPGSVAHFDLPKDVTGGDVAFAIINDQGGVSKDFHAHI
ncbi:molecular chaperone [Citrobacter sp. Cu233]|uniref:fimbrial biogenesis chaperone n=1 Tax=Citrobacter sp. Cu233 TaxID=2985160 RepID=UPI0025774812|nr:molecular chaperone [Citrobacter sp. Cu233]MDM2932570.1 molecular chaperone [Citrobacter sp. Cu233]